MENKKTKKCNHKLVKQSERISEYGITYTDWRCTVCGYVINKQTYDIPDFEVVNNGQTKYCPHCAKTGDFCERDDCLAMPKKGWNLPPTTEWQYNPLTGEPHGMKARAKGIFSMWQTWFTIALLALLALSWGFAGESRNYKTEIQMNENLIKTNSNERAKLKKEWLKIEEKVIKPQQEISRKAEEIITNAKSERTVKIEAPSQKLKRENECLRMKNDFMKKYKTLATDEVCKEEIKKINEARADAIDKPVEPNLALARAVAQAEGNGINKTNPCNIRDFKTGKFKVFEDREEGIRNCHNVFVKYTAVNPNVDVLGAINTFSPASDNNNPKQHASNIIYILADKYNVKADYTTKITDLLKI